MYGYPQHTKESVREKLSTDEKWIKEALIYLYKCQTEEEKSGDTVIEQNGKGFNYEDAPILSDYAIRILNSKDLGELQLTVAKQRLPKYWRQILLLVQSKPDLL